MILVYLLPVTTIGGIEQVAGIEFIHDAVVECTENPTIRKLIQDTTQAEHDGLFLVALSIDEPTPDELTLYNAREIPPPPTPDYIRGCEILHNPNRPMPATDVAEILRIFGRRLGYDF